jgi:hypothetical protein
MTVNVITLYTWLPWKLRQRSLRNAGNDQHRITSRKTVILEAYLSGSLWVIKMDDARTDYLPKYLHIWVVKYRLEKIIHVLQHCIVNLYVLRRAKTSTLLLTFELGWGEWYNYAQAVLSPKMIPLHQMDFSEPIGICCRRRKPHLWWLANLPLLSHGSQPSATRNLHM